MKRSPLKRSGSKLRTASPLRRKTILRSGRNRLVRLEVNLRALDPTARRRAREHATAYAERVREFDYMGWVKTLPCLLGGSWSLRHPRGQLTPCSGEIQADHAGDRVFPHKAPDSTCVPMCSGHHGERTNGPSCTNGAFRAFRGDAMKEWRHAAIPLIQLHALRVGVPVPDDGGRSPAYLDALARNDNSSRGRKLYGSIEW